MKKVAVVGSGAVGQTLSNGFLKHGYAVVRATREPAKLSQWLSGAGANASVLGLAEATASADLVVLAVKGEGAEEAVALCGAGLDGKTVLDTTNPIAVGSGPPKNGVLEYFTAQNDSLMERLQRKAPKARFVKAFSCVGNTVMVNPSFGARPTMFICGNSSEAKAETTGILERFGWEVADMGPVEGARAIEPLCILWCIPGFAGKSWGHAFKMLWPSH